MEHCIDIETGRLIHAYEVGHLSEDDQDRFEIHLLDCTHCFKEVRSFEAMATLLREDLDVREVLQEEATGSAPASPESFLHRIWRYLWPDTPAAFRPALIYTVLLLTIIPATMWLNTGGIQEGIPQEIRPVEVIRFFPGLRGGEEHVLHRSAFDVGQIGFVYRGAKPDIPYRVVIATDAGEIVYREEAFITFDENQTGYLDLPLAHLKPGNYRLEIDNPADPQSTPQEYNFSIVD